MRTLLGIDAIRKTVVGLALLLSPLAQPRSTAAADWTVEYPEWGDCAKDKDCIMVVPMCGMPPAINRRYRREYKLWESRQYQGTVDCASIVDPLRPDLIGFAALCRAKRCEAVPLRNLPAKDVAEVLRLLAEDLVSELQEEASIDRQRSIILQLSPILTGEQSKVLIPFLRSKDAWLRRAAVGGLLRATGDPIYSSLAAQDIAEFISSTDPGSLLHSGRPPFMFLFEHYFPIADVSREDAGPQIYLPLFRVIAHSKIKWFYWERGVGALCNSGSREDANFLFETYHEVRDGKGGPNPDWVAVDRRRQIIHGLSRILDLGLPGYGNYEFERVEKEQYRSVASALGKEGALRQPDYHEAIADLTARLTALLNRFKRMDSEGHPSVPTEQAHHLELLPLYEERGKLYYLQGSHERAVADFSKGIRLESESHQFYEYRGNAYRGLNKLDLALFDYNKAIEVRPFPTTYHERAVLHVLRREYDSAIADETKYLDYKFGTTGDSASSYFNRGKAFFFKGDVGSARRDIDRAADIDLFNAEYQYYRGLVRYCSEDYGMSLQFYKRGLELEPSKQAYEDFKQNVPSRKPSDEQDVRSKILELFRERL